MKAVLFANSKAEVGSCSHCKTMLNGHLALLSLVLAVGKEGHTSRWISLSALLAFTYMSSQQLSNSANYIQTSRGGYLKGPVAIHMPTN
jgi:hypothetical protein